VKQVGHGVYATEVGQRAAGAVQTGLHFGAQAFRIIPGEIGVKDRWRYRFAEIREKTIKQHEPV
jgi:hypothetical protein